MKNGRKEILRGEESFPKVQKNDGNWEEEGVSVLEW